MAFSNRLYLSVAFFFALLIAYLSTSLRVDSTTFFAMIAVLIYVIWLESYLLKRNHLRMARFIASFSVILLIGWLCNTIHYSALTFKRPEIDAHLLLLDRALGFDWQSLNDWFRARPMIDVVLSVAYASLVAQLLIALFFLSKPNHEMETRELLNAYCLSLIVTVLLAAIWPAHAMCRMAGLETSADPDILGRAACAFLPVYDGLRDGTLTILDWSHIDGLVTFPSFHTTAAILLAWSMRNVPIARWVFLVLNILMIVATPTHGGHYLIDVLAGAVLAVASIAYVNWQQRPVFRQTALSRATRAEQTAT